jgi:hypothetical protein
MVAKSPKYLMPQCKRMTAFSVFDPRPVGPLLFFRVLSPKFLSLTSEVESRLADRVNRVGGTSTVADRHLNLTQHKVCAHLAAVKYV